MKTFQEFMLFCEEVEDKSKALGFSATIRRARPGGRVGAERKKSAPEIRRMKAVGGGKMAPVGSYKARKDIGTQRKSETRVQQPEQERGSAREKQLAAAKEERRKAAQARIAAKKAGAKPEAKKPTSKEAEKTATKLLAKKKAETPKPAAKPRREWKHETGGGMTRAERDKARNKEKGEALKKRKAELIKDFTEKHGRAPKGKERTKLLGLAHGTVKAGV